MNREIMEKNGIWSEFQMSKANVIKHALQNEKDTYLEQKGFYKFSYLTNSGTKLIKDFTDHYQYCNIVCINKNSSFVPF